MSVFLFSDFECPFCKTANGVFDRLVERFGDRVRFVYKHFPLSGACNPSVRSSGHPNACRAARAAVCAAERGGFDAFHRAVFENGADPPGLLRAAVQAGLDPTELTRCSESLRAEDLVAADVRDGIALGVTSTPSFLVDDLLVTGARDEEALAQLIQSALSESASK